MSATATAVPTWGELGYRAMRLLNEWGLAVGRRFAAWGIRRWRRAHPYRPRRVGPTTITTVVDPFPAAVWRAIQEPLRQSEPPPGMVFNISTWQLEPAPPEMAAMQRKFAEQTLRAQAGDGARHHWRIYQ